MNTFDTIGHSSELDEDPQQMSMQDYHAHQAIGASTAKLALKSLQLFNDARQGIYVQADKPHFQVGTLAHMMVLEPEKFGRLVTFSGPTNPATGKMYGRDTAKFAAWQEQFPGVTVVEPWLYTMLERMPREVHEALKGTVREQSFFAELDGLRVKCRPDALAPGLILDLKTCVDVDRIERDIVKNGYWFTAAWYRAVMKAATGKSHRHKLIFVEKGAPYRWRIVSLDISYVMHGNAIVASVLDKIAAASFSGDWSDGAQIEFEATMPPWLDPEDNDDGDDE